VEVSSSRRQILILGLYATGTAPSDFEAVQAKYHRRITTMLQNSATATY
jgi:hypothetical protein